MAKNKSVSGTLLYVFFLLVYILILGAGIFYGLGKAWTFAEEYEDAIPTKVMHEKYGWGMKRLADFAEAIADEYQNFADGELSAEDYREFVFQECGIKFTANE